MLRVFLNDSFRIGSDWMSRIRSKVRPRPVVFVVVGVLASFDDSVAVEMIDGCVSVTLVVVVVVICVVVVGSEISSWLSILFVMVSGG